jgi:hypothetical protein
MITTAPVVLQLVTSPFLWQLFLGMNPSSCIEPKLSRVSFGPEIILFFDSHHFSLEMKAFQHKHRLEHALNRF